MMNRTIISTEDGSATIYVESLNQSYHSTHGAISESQHIFIKDGLKYYEPQQQVNILEIGFGTGLNALLSLDYARRNSVNVNYFTVEKYPLEKEEYLALNYPDFLPKINHQDFIDLHETSWDEEVQLDKNFTLYKSMVDIKMMQLQADYYEVVFFDAFSPDQQPELWSRDIFQLIYKSMKRGGVLTTYSVKGDVKRALKSAGFSIEKLAGPKGKREILRAKRL